MKFNKKWFTLIELLIAITIFFILVVMSYANYAYYQNIARVKLSLKEISQSINTAKNMAISWYDDNSKNQSIWVYFEKWSNQVKYYAFDYTLTWSDINISNDKTPIKVHNLQSNVNISQITPNKDNIMIFYSAIEAKPEIITFLDNWVRQNLSDSEIKFDVSFKNSTNFPLKRELKYIKQTNLVDYK